MRTQKFVLLALSVAGLIAITNCSKKEVGGNSDSITENLTAIPKGGGGIDSVIPLTICQRALMRYYILDKQNYQATVSSQDTLLDGGVFRLYYSNSDSMLMSFKCKSRDTIYVKQITSYAGDPDFLSVYYRGQVYDTRLESFDDVEREIRNMALYIILMRKDIKDRLENRTTRFGYNCNCARMTTMISAGFGGMASASQRRAMASMNHFAAFWGCTDVRVLGIDTSCEPLSSHGICVTTVEWSANCPWYTIPFGLA